MSSDRYHLQSVLKALAGTEAELIAAVEAATAHINQDERATLDGVEVSDSSYQEWRDSGGPDRRAAPREG